MSQITDAAGRITALAYSAGRLSSITDPAGRVTDFQYDASGRLAQMTGHDPDIAGPAARPQMTFTYDTVTGQHSAITDPSGQTTTYNYNSLRMLDGITTPDGQTRQLTPQQAYGLVDTSTGSGTSSSPAPLVWPGASGSERDPLGNETTFTLDRFGYVLSDTDAQRNTTVYHRDDDGLVTERIDPDPDGPGPLNSPVTLFSYAARGNLLSVTHQMGLPVRGPMGVGGGHPALHSS